MSGDVIQATCQQHGVYLGWLCPTCANALTRIGVSGLDSFGYAMYDRQALQDGDAALLAAQEPGPR